MKLQLARAQALLTQKKPKPDPALKVLQPLLKRKDAKWPVFHYAGIAFIQKRDYSAACKMLLAALELGSNEPETYHSISICHFNLGAFDEAVVFEKKALERNSNFFKGWLHLGSVYRAQARLEEALKCFQKANQLDNSKSGIAYRIAEIYKAQGDMDKALELLNITIKMDRKYYDAWIDKAEILKIKEKFEEAEDCLNFVLAEKPKNLPARVTLAELFKYKGDYAKAIELYERLMEEYPKVGGVRVNYALCMQDLGQFDESEKNYLQALEDQPGAFESFSNYLMGLHYNPKRTKEEIFEAHLDWDHHFAPKERPERPNPFNQEKDKKLRIGFISGGFRRHPVGWMIAAGLENLSKSQFEIYCYTTNNTYDKTTERIYKKADKWQSVIGYKDEVIARMIREDEIDILVELSGHSADTRLKTVVLEPAPVVVKWVGGLFNTTGLKSIDYLLTDWHETPAGEEKYYTEKLVRMPDDYICYLPPYYAPDAEPLPAKENGYITFGCFNNPTKVNNEILEKWAEIMNRVPESRLFLKSKQYDTEALRQRIIDKMGECGIAENRLLFEGQSPHNELLSCYNRIDIALDPWPYSGGLTTCEALWMGVPVITKPGPTFAGRHSATHLTNAGYSEWVTDDWDEYTEKAVDLAENIDALAELRMKMREQVANSPVCDGKRFGAHLAVAFREMWKQRVEGYKKNLLEGEWQDHIAVKALSDEEIAASVAASAGAANEDELIFDSSFIDGDDSAEAEDHNQHSAKSVKKETDDDLLNGVHTNGSSKPSAYSENGMRESLPEVFRIETKDGVTVCTPGDLKLLTPYVLLEQEEWFEPELNFVRNYLKPGMTALDIGAAFGVYSLPMAKITGNEGKVYAFEPGYVTRRNLEMSKVENHLDNLDVVGKAISDTPGQATYHVAETPELNKLDETGSEKVTAITLDSWWEFEGRPDIDFIKLDVNGAEAKALAGAENLLKNNDPVLLFAMAEGAQLLSETIKKLSELQYNIFGYVPGPGLLTPFDAKAGSDPYLMNLIAVKDNRVEALKEDGFIHNDTFEPEEPETGLWKHVLRKQPWAEKLISGWEKQSLSLQNKSYLQALDYLCAAEQLDVHASPTSRSEKAVLLLGAAQILIQIYNSGTNSTSVSLTLIRVLNALGKRGQAVEIMQKLIETTKLGQQNINTELPFLLPLPEQDGAAIQTDFSKWLMVRVIEGWILLNDVTTYLSGEQERKLMKGLDGNGEITESLKKLIRVNRSLQSGENQKIYSEKSSNNVVTKNLEKLTYLYPGGQGGAHGLHAIRAQSMTREISKFGIESDAVSASDPQFLYKILEAGKNQNHAIYSGVMGFDAWLETDMNLQGNIYDLLKINIICSLADHPYTNFMWNRMERFPKSGVLFTSTASIADEFKKIYGTENKVIVHEKNSPTIEVDRNLANKSLKSRSIDVLIPWGLHKFLGEQKKLKQQLQQFGTRAVKLGGMIYEISMEDYDRSIFEVFLSSSKSILGNEYQFSNPRSHEDRLWLNVLSLVDWTVRRDRRLRMLINLKDIPADKQVVITAHPKVAEFIPGLSKRTNIKWVGEVGAERLNKLYAGSKIVLVCNPTFPDMIHERIRNSMAWGACVVSDYSPGLASVFKHDQDILFTDNAGTEISNCVSRSIDELQQVADNGKQIINTQFTKEAHIKWLLNMIQENM